MRPVSDKLQDEALAVDAARTSNMQQLWRSSHEQGANAIWLEQLYETYLNTPRELSEKWRSYFDRIYDASERRGVNHAELVESFRGLGSKRSSVSPEASLAQDKQVQLNQLVQAYREFGHQEANLDPIGLEAPEVAEKLDTEFHGLGEDDATSEFATDTLHIGKARASLEHIVDSLRAIYCGNIGWEYMHLANSEERQWFQRRIEPWLGRYRTEDEQSRSILKKLVASEGLERFLATRFSGAKRFGLEGAESLIPMLDQLIQCAGTHGAQEMVLGMAHRGRLNVMVNLLGKDPGDLCSEFEGNILDQDLASGDVKYHMGFSTNIHTPGGQVHLSLAFNPSHLAIVTPVVEGSVRARQDHRGYADNKRAVLPVVIHGDAAFAAQGVIMETIQMSQTRGFSTGGTIHIIVNNQIGFTTSRRDDARSTLYCSDIAKMARSPVIHVNADDPEAAVLASEVAVDFRNEFRRDVVIDLICYRRRGHNEADDPGITQPMMYKKITDHPTTLSLYSSRLQSEGLVSAEEVFGLEADYRTDVEAGEMVLEEISLTNQKFDWQEYVNADPNQEVETGYDQDRFRELAEVCTTTPQGFNLHRQVETVLADRRKMAAGGLDANWGFAEMMAYATLLNDDFSIRITGQDVRRGTFSHRHVLLHDQESGHGYIPLTGLALGENQFEIYDSLLSEEAVLAFEYGYSATMPKTLVIWEAQFGDFANGAQVVIDQFISSAQAKWGRLSGLTMLLPHGYEGQGPEHSSARLERYLQLCSGNNMRVCVPTTAAQIFHLLRRQLLHPVRRPLVVMSPKSLLRSVAASSPLDDLCYGSFKPMIDDTSDAKPEAVKRVVLCSGKVYYDLDRYRSENERTDTALVRMEQLYPFPEQQLHEICARYPEAQHWVWCQEEPQNQGAWMTVCHDIDAQLQRFDSGHKLIYAGRERSSSTASGYMKVHTSQQNDLVAQAFTKR